ncbi:MAG: hypothetical protein HOP15_13365 [Planctomycetes bacterium]|nr:hypothetical protein [Planctomycetota bacterium]
MSQPGRAEAIPSTADILAREEARARVVEAVLALEEPLRTTLVLRFLEDLPPRVVAARMHVPVETVRTRTRRGLELLRANLDHSFGAREHWLAALVPWTRHSPAPLGLTLAAMSIPAKLAVSTAALALLAWFLWPQEAAPAVATPSSAKHAEPAGESRDVVSAGLTAATSPASQAREIVAEPSGQQSSLAEPTGALRVRVRSPNNPHALDTSVSDYVVRVVPGALENPDLCALEAATDQAGVARFEAVPVGEARVTVDRNFAPPSTVTVVAGVETELEIRVGHGFDIAGLVTDEAGRPVAGAGIWLGKSPELAHGTRVARSAADGSFRLRGILHANLGARAPGYRPSQIAYFFGAPQGEVSAHLVLRAGSGELRGSVTDLSGQPVPGAVVRVGSPGPTDRNANQDLDEDWGTLARTDEEGDFHVTGLNPGPCPLLVRCAGLALLRGEVEVPAGGSASFTGVLLPEAALAGHVRDDLGAPVSGALVRVGQEEGPFRASARTRTDGSFRVGALEPGRTLSAWIEDAPGSARTEFPSEVGRTAQWEAVLEALGEIRGRVLDERGAPLARWGVYLDDQAPGLLEPDEHGMTTEANGSFLFARVHDRLHQLSLNAPGAGFVLSLARTNVRPSPDELVLRVSDAMIPSARIVGTFLDEAGRPLPTAQILPWATGSPGAGFESCDPRTGRFELGPYPAGPMQLIFRAPGRGTLVRGPHALAPGETWDVGEVRLEPEGRLRVRLVPAGLEPDESLDLVLEPFLEPFEGTGSERLSPPLAPHAYTLHVSGGEFEQLALAFAIESGVETVLDVPLRRGWRTRVVVRAPDSIPLGRLLVHLPSGTLEDFLWHRERESFVETLRLPAGTFAVEATAGALRAAGTLVVEPVDRDEPALVLTLE